ncbi:MAG: hypothetical protein IPH20_00890 [Bacteroidales bacterium]|nr:hypothetical protein [Bacteroidales bacterium]
MKKLLLLLTGILVIVKLNGQIAYREGFIVLNNHDTLHGYIENNPYYKLTKSVSFRLNDQSPPVAYLPDSIISFGFSDHKYFESHLLIEKDIPVRKNLQCLVKGYISLYLLNEQSKNRYFVRDSIQNFHELLETFKKVAKGKMSNYEYVFTMQKIMNDRIFIYPQIEKSRLKTGSLTELITHYNSTKNDDKSIVYRSKDKIEVTPIIHSGVNYRFSNVGELGYTGGITFDFYNSVKNDILSFNCGIFYSSVTYSAKEKGDFDLVFPINLAFRMGSKKAAPNFYAGISPVFSTGIKYYSDDKYYLFSPFVFDLGINKSFYIKDRRKIYTDFRIYNNFIGLSLGYCF